MDEGVRVRGSIPGSYTLLIAQEVGLASGSLDPLLAGLGVTELELRGSDAHLTEAQQVAALANALDLVDEPGFGFRLGRRLTIAAHGPLGFLISTSRDLREALESAAAYAPTRVSFLRLDAASSEDDLVLTCTFDVDASPEVRRCMAEALSVVVLDLAGFIVGRPVREIEVLFPHPDPGVESDFLPCPTRFDGEALTFTVPGATAGSANASADDALHELARVQCEALLAALPRDDSIRSELERVLLASPAGKTSEEDAAAAMFVSARTLARRLSAEGATFRLVRDDLLARRAQGHLRDGVPVATIAALLGYHDASGFRRAFKRWHGVTPDEWRRVHQPAGS